MSLANLNPTLAQLSRRQSLGMGAALMTVGAGGVANAADKLVFDFKKPEDNLTAWVKLNASLESGAETVGYYSGQVVAATDPEKANVPLFGYEGFGMSRVTKLPDGRYELKIPYSVSRELLMDILHYGADAEIVEPAVLREQAKTLLELALSNYGKK